MLRRILLVFFLLFSLGVLLAPMPASAATGAGGDFVPGELLVKFRTGTRSADIADAHRTSGGRVERTVRGGDGQVLSLIHISEPTRPY